MAEVYHKYVRAGETVPPPTKEQLDREESHAKYTAARARKETALAELRESEAKKRSGELIEKSIAVRQASFLLTTIRQRLLALPAQVAHKVGEPDAHRIRLIVDEAIRAALTELADFPDIVTTKGQYAENGEKRPEKRKAPRLKASKTG